MNEGTVTGAKILIALHSLWDNFLQGAGTLFSTAAERAHSHSYFLRHGFIPTAPLLIEFSEYRSLTAVEVAETYVKYLRQIGDHEAAKTIHEFLPVFRLGDYKISLRAIFPEIERVAREQIYEPGTIDQITSLPSLRFAANKYCCAHETQGLPVKGWVRVDPFVLTVLSAFDYAYVPKQNTENLPFRRVFRFVPSRHRVLHGYDDVYSEQHVVNAITLLWMALQFGRAFQIDGIRVSSLEKVKAADIEKLRLNRRKVNRRVTAFWRSIQNHRLPLSSKLLIPK